jgi:hypothetical protein
MYSLIQLYTKEYGLYGCTYAPYGMIVPTCRALSNDETMFTLWLGLLRDILIPTMDRFRCVSPIAQLRLFL